MDRERLRLDIPCLQREIGDIAWGSEGKEGAI